MPSFWYSRNISVQMAPSSTLTTCTPAAATISYGSAPIRRTAAPSTNGSMCSNRTGPPATIAAVIEAAPAGSAPTIRTLGARSLR